MGGIIFSGHDPIKISFCQECGTGIEIKKPGLKNAFYYEIIGGKGIISTAADKGHFIPNIKLQPLGKLTADVELIGIVRTEIRSFLQRRREPGQMLLFFRFNAGQHATHRLFIHRKKHKGLKAGTINGNIVIVGKFSVN